MDGEAPNIIVHRDGERLGPFTFDEARARVSDGRLIHADIATLVGTDKCLSVATILGITAPPPPAPLTATSSPELLTSAVPLRKGKVVGVLIAIAVGCIMLVCLVAGPGNVRTFFRMWKYFPEAFGEAFLGKKPTSSETTGEAQKNRGTPQSEQSAKQSGPADLTATMDEDPSRKLRAMTAADARIYGRNMAIAMFEKTKSTIRENLTDINSTLMRPKGLPAYTEENVDPRVRENFITDFAAGDLAKIKEDGVTEDVVREFANGFRQGSFEIRSGTDAQTLRQKASQAAEEQARRSQDAQAQRDHQEQARLEGERAARQQRAGEWKEILSAATKLLNDYRNAKTYGEKEDLLLLSGGPRSLRNGVGLPSPLEVAKRDPEYATLQNILDEFDAAIRRDDRRSPDFVRNATPTLGEQRQGSTPQQSSTPDEANSNDTRDLDKLLTAWLDASNSGNVQTEAALYWDHVDYYDEGSLSHDQLIASLAKDHQRWPVKRYEIKKVLDIEKLGPSAWHLVFRMDFAAQNSATKSKSSGTADESWIIRRDAAGAVKIISVKEEVKLKSGRR